MQAKRGETLVWDLRVRLFHWSLVLFFLVAYFFEHEWPGLHSHAGYTIVLLILFRVIWGIIGSTYARFSSFVVPPKDIWVHLIALASRGYRPQAGHNPAGGIMVILLLFSLSLTAMTGMVLFAMAGSGPFAGTVVAQWSERPFVLIHHYSSDVSMVLVIVHIVGVVVMSRIVGENLTLSMITGVKRERG